MAIQSVDSEPPHHFDSSILREYDIRGVVGETLSVDDARAVGCAFGTLMHRDNYSSVAVGYDGRLSSPELEEALVSGLVATGMNVRRIGLGPTPMLYFAVAFHDLDAGIMVTGSHNPAEYNGFKLLNRDRRFHGDMIQEIGRVAAAGQFFEGAGSATNLDVTWPYTTEVSEAFKATQSDLNVVWDAGNGAAGEILWRLKAILPGQHTLLFDEVDGLFPNHHPDPTVPENLTSLIESVRQTGADVGIAFDGDGDRIGVVDAGGEIVWGDQLLAIFAEQILRDRPGATIITDVKASQTVIDHIRDHGGNPLMWKTGHSLIKEKMDETGSPLAGEMSGHMFFADEYFGYDDALYAAVRLLRILSQSEKSLAELRNALPEVHNTPEVRITCDDAHKFRIIDDVKERCANRGLRIVDIDGVRVSNGDGWWLLRASNTQNALVARAESTDADGLDRLKLGILEQLAASGIRGDQLPADLLPRT